MNLLDKIFLGGINIGRVDMDIKYGIQTEFMGFISLSKDLFDEMVDANKLYQQLVNELSDPEKMWRGSD